MTREIHIHVEEPSMEAFLGDFLPRVLREDVPWRLIDHGSKWQLLRVLPDRLRGYAARHRAHRPKILVLVDRDDDDCAALKAQLDAAALGAGLVSRTGNHDAAFDVVNRIVVEELEAWFFGDGVALTQAWPGVPASLAKRQRYRDPDAITGGTHEALLKVLQSAGHWRGTAKLPKSDTARRMAALIDPARNRLRSFQHFMTGLDALVAAA